MSKETAASTQHTDTVQWTCNKNYPSVCLALFSLPTVCPSTQNHRLKQKRNEWWHCMSAFVFFCLLTNQGTVSCLVSKTNVLDCFNLLFTLLTCCKSCLDISIYMNVDDEICTATNNMQHITNSTYTRLEADMQWNVVCLTSSSLGRCLSGTTKLDDGSSIF